jgi:hypothetical protein
MLKKYGLDTSYLSLSRYLFSLADVTVFEEKNSFCTFFVPFKNIFINVRYLLLAIYFYTIILKRQ